MGRLVDSRFEIVRDLGSGTVVDVYLADDLVLGRQVALEVLLPHFGEDEAFLERFRREVGRAAGLAHPNIAQIVHRGQAEGTYYVAMEYPAGRSLKSITSQHAPVSADLLTSVALQVLEALRFAHRQNIFHGDLNPENIFVDDEGRVKITDFGMARATQGRAVQEPPADALSDLQSLGVVMYQMAGGRLPFEADEVVAIPGKLGAIIMRALGAGPDAPYLTAQAMLADLRGAQEDDTPVGAHGFAEEAARVMAASTAVAAGPPAAPQAHGGSDLQSDGQALTPDRQGPIIEPAEQPGRPRRSWPWVLVTILILALAMTAYLIVTNRSETAGPDLASVPEVVGLTEARAIAKLQAAGFDYRVVGTEPSAEVKEGAVLRQGVVAGVKLEKGTTLGIWISSGTGQVGVPDVAGLTEADAAERLSLAGFEVVAKPEVGSDVEIGTVLRQNPEAGKRVDPGATITITVAAITNTVRVPTLTGISQETAVALLEGMGLVADAQETDSALPGGTVVRQDPVGSTEVLPGTTVSIFVSNAPTAKTVIVPAVGALGLTEAEAKAILSRYGLKSEVIDLETPDFKPGLCIYQDPAYGAEAKVGGVVKITIARKPTTTTLPPPAAGSTRYDHTDSRIVKTGTWTDYTVASAYLGSYGRSNSAGAKATIYFTGTRLDWIGMKGITTGIADVYLDGVKKATIDLAAPAATYNVNVWSTGTLARRSHKVTIVLSSTSPAGKFVTLDAVEIWGTINAAP